LSPESYIFPDWPCPPRVRAAITTRQGGFSGGSFSSFNVADHVGDDPQSVARNRGKLVDELALQDQPVWLQQVHGTRIVDATAMPVLPEADGSFASEPGAVCAVLTADCLPVLLTDTQGTRVAALHAGWRGLAAGILEQGVDALEIEPGDLLAYFGPAIGPDAFEVGADVREAFIGSNPDADTAFRATVKGKWMADIYSLAAQRLNAKGVKKIHGGGSCTFHEASKFYSYRRDKTCGRMASLIWIDESG